MSRAAACTSLRRISARDASEGFMNTATRAALGTSSWRIASRLATNPASEKFDAGRFSSRRADARDQTRLDWVLANAEDNWDGRGRGFGRAGSGWAAWYSDDRNPAAG